MKESSFMRHKLNEDVPGWPVLSRATSFASSTTFLDRAGSLNCPPMNSAATGYRYLTSTRGVRGGHARVEVTRIGVLDVVGLLQQGETVDSLSPTASPTSPALEFTSARSITKITGG